MSTLESHASLSVVGEILYAARVLGTDGWKVLGERDMAMPDASSLEADTLALFSLLQKRNLPYLLVGGVALLKYIDGRNTQDIDLLISVDSLSALPEIFISDQNALFARGRFQSVRVDLLLTTDPLFKRVQVEFATTHQFNEMNVRCATVEGLIVLKLYALPALYRQGDGQKIAIYETDILMLCQRYRPALAPLLEIVHPHVDPGQYDELKAITFEIEQRLARMDRTQRSSGEPR